MSLTDPQRRLLRVLADEPDERGMSPRSIARALWPDSRGWERRSNRGSTPAGGALGATMPMKAATMLHRLQALGLVSQWGPAGLSDSLWWLTDAGRSALDDDSGIEVPVRHREPPRQTSPKPSKVAP